MTGSGCEKLFSPRAADYAKYRFQYPVALYQYLSGLCLHHELAWDCATGSGQAAVALADFFNKVVATDASAEQLSYARPHPNVDYLQCPAENASLADGSADLICVANAVHWFDRDLFYKEAKRILKKDGIVAVWCAALPEMDPQIDKIVRHYHSGILKDYWSERVKVVEVHYKTLDFPFTEVDSPQFAVEADWTLTELVGFIRSWSATILYDADTGQDLAKALAADLEAVWTPNETKHFRWWLGLRVGRL